MAEAHEPSRVVRDHLRRSAEVLAAAAERCPTDLARAAEAVARSCAAGGKVLFAGNGGSAADAEHLAAELVNRLSQRRERPAIAALALTTNGAILTATANDRTFEEIFSRQVDALGRRGDVLLCLTTSGRSPNLLRAVAAARAGGLHTLAFTGAAGGPLAEVAEVVVRVPSDDAQEVQEAQIALGHALCLLVERALHPGAFPPNG